MIQALHRRRFAGLLGVGALGALGAGPVARWANAAAAELPLFDAHIHYSHDAWALVPPPPACPG